MQDEQSYSYHASHVLLLSSNDVTAFMEYKINGGRTFRSSLKVFDFFFEKTGIVMMQWNRME